MHAVGAARFWMDDHPAVEPLRLRRMPMLATALCFAAGDALALRWHGPMLLASATALLGVLALLSLRVAPRVVLVAALAFWIAVGCWCAQLQPRVPSQAQLTHFADGLSRIVRGRVARTRVLTLPPEDDAPQAAQPWQVEPGGWETDSATASQSVDLDVLAVEDVTPDVSRMKAVSGGVRVTMLGPPLPLRCGDVVEVPLRLREPEDYLDPGAWSYRKQLLSENIGVLATAKPGRIRTVASSHATWRCRLYAAQAWAAARLSAFAASGANRRLPMFARLTGQDIAMLNAMIFGDRTQLSQSLRVGFERTGTFHLFVVSGLHLGLLAFGVYWLLRRVHAPEGVAVLTTIAISIAYALLTGFGQPVQRALGMACVFLLARWLRRQGSALNALGIAALAILAVDPRALFDAGFQMTFLVILSIAGIASPLSERLIGPWRQSLRDLGVLSIDVHIPPRLAQFRVRVRMACDLSESLLHRRLRNLPVWVLRFFFHVFDGLLLGVATEACMVLPMALYFHRATLFALPLNVIAIPMVAALLCTGLAAFLLSLISPWLAALPGAATACLLHAVRFFVAHAQRSALGDIRVPMPAAGGVVLAGVTIAFACWALRARRRVWIAAGLAATLVAPLGVVWPARPITHAATLEVTALDVGQGDSLLVVSPTGRTLLVDAGGPTGIAGLLSAKVAGETRWDVGEEVVAPYLWSRHIRRLDAVLLTHAHSDHMGGMPAILRDFRPRELWLSVEPARSAGLRALLAEAHTLGITVRHFRAGDGFAWAGTNVSVLAPEAGYTNPNTPVNNDSLVVRLDYGRASALLEGDAEAPSEAAMLANKRVAPATLLKVGHHGSKTSTNPAFLAAVAPAEAVISVGRHNTFGHPREEILERLEDAHVETFRTDRAGAETFLLTEDGGISAASAASN